MLQLTENNILEFLKILHNCWSIYSSSKWSLNNPAKGHCGVTALIVNDYFGGDILKTKTPDGWHFYNRIDETAFDFTGSQFEEKPVYLDILSTREEAFSDTNTEQYSYLKERIQKYMMKKCHN
ncbi:MAG TPA: hypothetical protein VHQ24_01785 [Lachnospiraceae bacterium]|nr:hypothetical protein [Lachnospiraceae bacterium]